MNVIAAYILTRAARLSSVVVKSQNILFTQQLAPSLGVFSLHCDSPKKVNTPEFTDEELNKLLSDDTVEAETDEAPCVIEEEEPASSPPEPPDIKDISEIAFMTAKSSSTFPSSSRVSRGLFSQVQSFAVSGHKHMILRGSSSSCVSPVLPFASPPLIPGEVASIEQNNECDIPAHLAPILESVEQVLAPPGPKHGPMPLHELANRNTKLQLLVQMNVDLSVIVKKGRQLERLLEQNFEVDIKPRVRFLVDKGVKADKVGWLLTRNPALLWTDIDDMQVRLNYLEVKKFNQAMIERILNHAPLWLTLSTTEIDGRLGFFQSGFRLTGDEVRELAVAFPQLVSTARWNTVKISTKLMEKVFGFNEFERKELLLRAGRCYLRPKTVGQSFGYFHNTVGLPRARLVQHPQLLLTRISRTQPRHQFLKFLNRDQFDPTQPGYISPDNLWQGSDEYFCQHIAKTSTDDYDMFLQSL